MKNHHIYTQIHIKESQSPTTKIQSSLTKIQINLLGIINYPKKEKRKKERNLTFRAKIRSLLGVVQNGQPVLENLIRTPNLEFADQTEVLPGAASAIIDLNLKPVELCFLSFRHHRRKIPCTHFLSPSEGRLLDLSLV